MNFIKRADDKLMRSMTSTKFPKRLQTPLSKFLFALGFNLFVIALFTVPDFVDGTIGWFNYLIFALYSTIIYYHWRFWRHIERERRQTP